MAFNRDHLPSLRDTIAQHNLRAEKKFGQNFLLDQNVTDKIVRFAGDLTNTNVFEIGPGPGGLTRSILHAQPRTLSAIEFDPRAIAALQELQEAATPHLNLIEGDALALNLHDLAPTPRAIIANLPYNIATPLLIGWLKQIAAQGPGAFTTMTLMFQKEVAERIVARVGDKAYGRLGVLCQWLCDVQLVYVLPAEAFTPPPKVKSAIVHFTIKPTAPDAPAFEILESLTEAAFGQRRKMVRSSLKNHAEALEACAISPTLRAENLSLQDYIRLAQYETARQNPEN